MKKYLTILVLSILIVPQITFASWWNPTTWFNNFSIFKKEDKTEILEKRIQELEKKLENKQVATSTPIIKAKTKNSIEEENTLKKPKEVVLEENFSSVVAGFYNGIVSDISNQLEILTILSTDSNRYISGVPRNVDSIKKLARMIISDDYQYNQFSNALDQYFNIYINDFNKQKESIDSYSNQLRKYQSDLGSQAIVISSGYIPKSKLQLYVDQRKNILNGINSSVESLSSSYNSLTDEYIKEKDRIANDLYNKGVTNLQNIDKYQPVNTYLPRAIHCVASTQGSLTTVDCL